MKRRDLLKGIGFGSVAGLFAGLKPVTKLMEETPPVESKNQYYCVDKDRPRFIDPARVISEEIRKEIRTPQQELVECWTGYSSFNTTTHTKTGDDLRVERHSPGGITRKRVWSVQVPFNAIGVCVEGLVIEVDGVTRLATSKEVRLVADSHKNMTEREWYSVHTYV